MISRFLFCTFKVIRKFFESQRKLYHKMAAVFARYAMTYVKRRVIRVIRTCNILLA
jgi:hypothetical protein